MVTQASNSVLNLVNPPITDAAFLDMAVDVAGGSVLVSTWPTPVVGAAPGIAGNPLISNGPGVVPSFQEVFITVEQITNLNTVILSGDLNYYVATTGSDSLNNGLSLSSPFATLQHVYDVVTGASSVLFGSHVCNIWIANGTYAVTNTNVFAAGTGNWVIQSISGNPNTVFLESTSTFVSPFVYDTHSQGILAFSDTNITIYNIALQCVNGNAIAASGSGANVVVSNVIFINNYVNLGAYSNGICNLIPPGYAVNGSAYANYGVSAGGFMYGSDPFNDKIITVTSSVVPNFAGAFANLNVSGILQDIGTTYAFTATGTRYIADNLSSIYTQGGGANYFPGSVAGSTSGFSIYA